MRFLVTGCQGYMGFRLQKFLVAHYPGATIIGAARSSKGRELACRFDRLQAVDKMLSFARPDIIFHCVGTVCPGPWDLLMSAHIQPTVQLLESVRRSSGKMPRVLIVGSAAEYGPGRPKTRFSETANPNPDTLYGVSKSLQTTVAMAYARWGVPVMVARLFNLLAMDAPPTFAVSRVVKLLEEIPRGKTRTVRVGPMNAVRDFVSLDDALRALCLVGLRGKSGEIYNVCSGRGTRMGDLFEALAQGAGVNVRWVSQGTWIIPVERLLLCRRSRKDSPRDWVDTQRGRPGRGQAYDVDGSMSLSVLHVLPGLGYGGTEFVVSRLAQAERALGVQNQVLYLKGQAPLAEDLRQGAFLVVG